MLASRSILPIFLFLSLLFSSMSVGCGNIFEDMADDSTEEARLEEAQMALDKGDYTTAVNMLLSLCGLSANDPTAGNATCDNATVSLLASAYMGRAGIDLIKIIDTADQGTSTGAQGTFTEFSTLLLNGNEEDASNAVTLLSNIQGRTEEQNLQMAVVAAADTILIIRDITSGFNQTTGLPNNIPAASDPATINAANQITENIPLIVQGISGSGIASADLTSDINAIKSNITTGGNPLLDPLGTDQTVTATDLVSYLQIL